jgi:hypothetical protein
VLETRISPRRSQARDPRRDVYCHACDVIASQLDLTGVQASPDLKADARDCIADRSCSPHRAGRPIERGEESVAGGLDLAPAAACQGGPHEPIVLVQQCAPLPVAERGRTNRRVHDIGEQDGRKHPVRLGERPDPGRELLDLADDRLLVAGPDEVVDARQLNELRAWNVLGEVAPHGDRQVLDVAVMDHQRRHPDRRQDVTHVALEDERHHRACGAGAGGLPLVTGVCLAQAPIAGRARREEADHEGTTVVRLNQVKPAAKKFDRLTHRVVGRR